MSEPKFQVGDVVRNVRPYPGEHAYYIGEILPNGYRTHSLVGTHSHRPDFRNSVTITFDYEHCYEKVPEGRA